MTRTTSPRPIDVEAQFPELSGHRSTCTRLHPRPGTPGPFESSVGGPFLWPTDEPWPMCRTAHKRDSGRRVADIHRWRRILDEAWSGAPDVGPSAEERELLASLETEYTVPGLGGTDPVPLLAVAQLFAKDIPDLIVPDGRDLLQVLWCPFSAHGQQATPGLTLLWRTASGCTPLLHPPLPQVVGDAAYVPEPCTLDPEQVLEHAFSELLPEDLRVRIEEWEEEAEEQTDEESADKGHFLTYDGDHSIAPGWKVGGYATWGVTGPHPTICSCGTPMALLLTIGSTEWSGTNSWVPLEDRKLIGAHGANTPTQVTVGRGGSLNIFSCPANPMHEHKVSLQ
ncbi:hypothetical protein QF037_004143 [Streptomyces canus]|uniref:hypothetical protein n=1 Tax=Streptomyces canus TaxID=58343 RepID=UPI00278957CE|nr:hypothetical protein [Streptomyces canus]MDQ0599798.1 hypothetical protein [Streptomyces canus]